MAATDGPKSKAEVAAILDRLEAAATKAEETDTELEELLKKLHASTRTLSPAALEPLFSSRGVRIVGQHAFHDTPKPQHLPALRCLNNVLVRSPDSRSFISTEVGAAKIMATFTRADPEAELPLSNILIFACHGGVLDLSSSFEDSSFAQTINATVARHAESGSLPTAEPTSVCSASLRLLSTLGASYESHAGQFVDSIDPVMDMVSRAAIPSPPLEPPVSLLVNCLSVLPLESKREMPTSAIDKLVEILDSSLGFYGTQDKEQELRPLLMCLYRAAQADAPEAKARLQAGLVATDDDRKEALGRGSTLPHKLLKLASMSAYPDVRELIMALYFELSAKDPSTFVHNVGFGNAAGYLSSQGISISQDAMGADAAGGAAVNPITGQRIDAESTGPDLPEMTDEEKEREAERLFVLFERLKATGVVDVENPVTQAARSGRIQELPDDPDSDDEKS